MVDPDLEQGLDASSGSIELLSISKIIISYVSASSSGPWLVTYSPDGTLATWEILDSEVVNSLGELTGGHIFHGVEFRYRWSVDPGSYASITVSPNGQFVAGYFDQTGLPQKWAVYSADPNHVNHPVREVLIGEYCIPTFLPTGQLAILANHRLELLDPPNFTTGLTFEISSADEFWRRFDQPLHRGVITRFEPNACISLWSLEPKGGLIRYIRMDIKDWEYAGYALSQTGTFLAHYSRDGVTILHTASGLSAASFDWPEGKFYRSVVYFDFVDGDRFLVGVFKTEESYGQYDVRLWRWDMDNASLWVGKPTTIESSVHSSIVFYPRLDGNLLAARVDTSSKVFDRIPIDGEVKSIFQVENGGEDERRSIAEPTGFELKIMEPWVRNDDTRMRGISYLLDSVQKLQLLVGLTTIQLWETTHTGPPTEGHLIKLLFIWHVPKPRCVPLCDVFLDGVTVRDRLPNTDRTKIDRNYEGLPLVDVIMANGAVDVRVTYTAYDGHPPERDFIHLLVMRNKQWQLSTNSRIPSYSWHALVSCWPIMRSGGESFENNLYAGLYKCIRCEFQSDVKCHMSSKGCLECRKANLYCPSQRGFHIIDGIYSLVQACIDESWSEFAKISGSHPYEPIVRDKVQNFAEFLLLVQVRGRIPTTLFCSDDTLAMPLERIIEARNIKLVRVLVDFMVTSATIGGDGGLGRGRLGFIYPITQNLLQLDMYYPEFVANIMEKSNYFEADVTDPFRIQNTIIIPGRDYRSDHPELHAFTMPTTLIVGKASLSTASTPAANAVLGNNDDNDLDTRYNRSWNPFGIQLRPVTLCMVPFVGINSTVKYVYDLGMGKIVSKKLKYSIFTKLALRGESALFATPGVSEAILNYKWEAGAKHVWYAFILGHMVYYALFLYTISPFFGSTPKPIRNTLIIIYMLIGAVFFICGELRQFLYGSWYENDGNRRKRRFRHSMSNYTLSFYNWVDIATYSLPLVAGGHVLRYDQSLPHYVFAFTILVIWAHFLLQLRIFKQLGIYMIILIEIGKIIGWLLFILAFVIFGFAFAMLSLMFNNNDVTENSGDKLKFNSFGNVLRTTWFFMSGDWGAADTFYDYLPLVIMTTLFSLFTVVVFMNVLIAVMSNIVSNTQKKCDRIWLQMYAQVIAEMEVYWTFEKVHRPDVIYYIASTEGLRRKKRREREDEE